MKILLALLVALIGFSCQYHSYYIVRHAEKEAAGSNMSSDVPLSAEGRERSHKLWALMSGKDLIAVYSTNTIRTKSTVQTIADYYNLPVKIYGPRPDSAFFAKLKKWKSHNVLIVGHSNTVDDIVNGLLGKNKLKDLDDSEYNHLFIVRMRKNKSFLIKQEIIPGNKKPLE